MSQDISLTVVQRVPQFQQGWRHMGVEWVAGSKEVCERLIMSFGTMTKDTVNSSGSPCFL
jgi:hypothetical protein